MVIGEGWKNKIVKQRKINFLSNRKPSEIQKLKLPFQRKFNSGQLGVEAEQSGQFCEDGGSDGWFAKDGAAPPPSFVKSPSNGFLPLGRRSQGPLGGLRVASLPLLQIHLTAISLRDLASVWRPSTTLPNFSAPA